MLDALRRDCEAMSVEQKLLHEAHMRSKAPSGGMKEMVLSLSKRASLTH